MRLKTRLTEKLGIEHPILLAPMHVMASFCNRGTAGGRMRDVVVIGAGKIGAFVAGLLASTGDYQVTLADRSAEVLGNLDRDERIRIVAADVEDSLKLIDLLNGQFAVLNAAPFRLTKHIAEAARAAGTHYLDLTEDVVSTRRVRELAAKANTAFIPQCGLAPGFASIVAFDVAIMP
jgi:saccharopine dehydrogenase-like NADP-dependent oxidoreductase